MRGSLRIALAAVWLGSMAGSTGLPMQAQDLAPATATVVPHVVQYSGTLGRTVAGSATVGGSEEITAPVPVRFALYAAQTGGEPVWQETQTVTPDSKGRYTVLLGSATPSGLPQAVFNSGDAKWLGIAVGQGEEQPRTVLVATPYSLKASDAETVGGHSPSEFLLAPKDASGKPETATAITQINTSQGILGAGTGPTVSLSLDPVYFQQLAANFPIKAYANTFTNTNTFTVPIVFASTQTFPGTASLTALNTFKAAQFLGATGTATSSKGYNSNGLVFQGSAYNSTASAAEAINFGWQSEPTLNNTSAPAGTMNLLYSTGSNALAETGLSIASNGKINFASGQTFPGTGPGTITGITTSSPLTGSGTSGSVALGVSTTGLETALGTYYAKTGAANTFTGNQTITGTESATATTTGATISGTNNTSGSGIGVEGTGSVGVLGNGAATGTSGVFTAGVGVSGNGALGVYGTSTYAGSAYSATGVYGFVPSTNTATDYYTVGVWGEADPTYGIGVFAQGTSFGIRALSSAGEGVYATSDTGYGVYGYSASLDGVFGETSGTTSTSYGVYGNTVAGAGTGVYGLSGSASGVTGHAYNGAGVWADTGSDFGASGGSEAALLATANNNYAIVAVNNGEYAAIYDTSAGTADGLDSYAASGTAVYGDSTSGKGVFGYTFASTGYGVYGEGISPSATGTGSSFAGFGAAVWADTNQSYSGSDQNAALQATADDNIAGFFQNNSAQHGTIFAVNTGSAGVGNSVPVITAGSKAGACEINNGGDVTCSGQMKSAVSVAGSVQKVEVYSVQSAENWIEDAGTAQLHGGSATVSLEQLFGKTVNADVDYHVFLTPNGDCKGLYVSAKSANGFEVHELGGGNSSIAFDYRIMAKRAGHEQERLVDATARINEMTMTNAERAVRDGKPVGKPLAAPVRPVMDQRNAPALPHPAVPRVKEQPKVKAPTMGPVAALAHHGNELPKQ